MTAATFQGKWFTTGGQAYSFTGTGTNANDVLVATDDVLQFDSFLLMSTAGAVQVLVSIDGTNYSTAPLSLTDMGAIDNNPVLVTVANRIYGFRGKFRFIKVTQNGATGSAATLMCGNL